jgi:hypothetical protein
MSARLWSNFDSVRFSAVYGVVRVGWLVMILLPFCEYVIVVACVGMMGSGVLLLWVGAKVMFSELACRVCEGAGRNLVRISLGLGASVLTPITITFLSR